MRKFLYLAFLSLGLLLFCCPLLAQDRTITGKVTGDDNRPLAGVTVNLRGSNRSTVTDNDGNFTITAKPGDQLRFSSVGFEAREIRVDNSTAVSIRLTSTEKSLEDVVVVAMDQRRKPRELGYSTQRVTGAEVQETQRENFLNSLQGRVAGLTVTATSGVAGASSSIVLRGFNSLSLSNEPLFVIDGIIVDNQTVNETSGGGQGIGLASDRTNRNNDYTNRMADLNPNDIESITVLKGPEATALYGSMASSGAIVITTRKAKTNKPAFQYDNNVRFSKVTRFPDTFDKYDNGTNGGSSAIFRYFGPEYAPNTPIFDNKRLFFQTGYAQTHNIGADFGLKNSIFRVSGSLFDQSGVVPTNAVRRYTARVSNTTKIGKFLELIPTVSFMRSENDKVLRSTAGYLLGLLVWPSDYSILNFKDGNEDKVPVFSATGANAEIDNPFFNVEANKSRDVTDRYIANLGVNLNPFEWLSIAGRFGYEHYKTDGYTRYHPQGFALTPSLGGQQDNYFRRYYGYNHTITATARKKVGNFNFRVMGGTMWQDYETRMFAVVGTNFVDSVGSGRMWKNGKIVTTKDLDALVGNPSDTNATRFNTRIRLLRNNLGEYNKQILRQMAYFGEFAVNYKELIYLNFTQRFETASTLPEVNRKYNYPGASISFIVSDLFPALARGGTLNFLKLRTSMAQTARLNSPYSTQSVFVNNFASGGGWSYGFVNNNQDLAPERQKTFEIGAETKLFRNKLGLDVTYYNTLNRDQIVEQFRLSYATGFVLNTQNAGSTRNQGVEVSLDVTPVNQRNFNWNVRLNFNRMWNEVLELPANVAEYYIADTWLYLNARGGLIKGMPTSTITANNYLRNNKGEILIDPTNGFPLTSGTTFMISGDRSPNFTLGTVNTLRMRNWRLSFLWDLKVGGDVYNGTNHYLTRAGKSLLTADRYEPRIVTGVLRDGKENSDNPTPNNIVIVPALNDAYYNTLPDAEFIEKDVNWFRLRDLTLNYTMPGSRLRFIHGLKSLSFFATGNDLILFTNYTGADPAVNGVTAGARGVGGYGFDFGTLAAPVSFNFGLRAGF
jgi:TonB-linked SusC/RagA family outer membrane protein